MRHPSKLAIWKKSKHAWLNFSADQLRMIIVSAGARERSKPRHTICRHRRRRFQAIAVYRRRFGEAPFLEKYDGCQMPAVENLWLPRGYAWWKVQKTK
ncbi:MAG TPA: hypothetical protein VF928_13245 [Usitatibacteraceae bacterium]